MNLFQRYTFRQALWPFLGAMTALTGLAVLTQSLSNLDLVAERGETALALVWITLLAMPQVIALLVPIAVFLGVTMALNRLCADSEMTVAAAAGMSRRQRVSPFLRLAIYAALANLLINLFIQPASFREMREQLFAIRTDLVASFMREGEFVPLGDRVTFYVREIDDDGVLNGVFIEDGRGGHSAAYAARRGRIAASQRGPVMLLESGVLTQSDQTGALSSLTFERYEFDLTVFVDNTTAMFFKESDKFLSELLRPAMSEIARAGGRDRLAAEGHYRLSAPLYNLAFALIAVAAFMSGEHRRVGYARNVIIAGACAIGLRLTGFAVQAAAESDDSLNVVQYLLPLVGIAAAVGLIARPRRKAPKTHGAAAVAGTAP